MARQRQKWPNETVGLRAEILELQEAMVPILEVCVNEGIIKQRYIIIEMLLPSIDEQAHQIASLARAIRQYRPNQEGRPPKWLEITEDSIAGAVGIIDSIVQIKQEMRRGMWASVAAYLKVCLNLAREIGDYLQIVENEPVPRAFYDAFENGLKPGRYRNRRV